MMPLVWYLISASHNRLVTKDGLTVVLLSQFKTHVVIHIWHDLSLIGVSVPHRIQRISECLSPVPLILRLVSVPQESTTRAGI